MRPWLAGPSLCLRHRLPRSQSFQGRGPYDPRGTCLPWTLVHTATQALGGPLLQGQPGHWPAHCDQLCCQSTFGQAQPLEIWLSPGTQTCLAPQPPAVRRALQRPCCPRAVLP